MTLQRQVSIKHMTNPLNIREFAILYEILLTAFKGNKSGAARALGISRTTFVKWDTDPPEWPYWNMVMRQVILDVCSSMKVHSHTKSAIRLHRQEIFRQLAKLPKSDPLSYELLDLQYDMSAASTHMRNLLIRKGMYQDKIMLPANNGGFSRKMIERAAQRLGIIKTIEGYGENKRSFWRLPNEDETDDQDTELMGSRLMTAEQSELFKPDKKAFKITKRKNRFMD